MCAKIKRKEYEHVSKEFTLDQKGLNTLKRIMSFVISVFLILALLPCSASAGQAGEQPAEAAAGDPVVLTIADMNTRSGNHYNGEMGMWRYLAERLGDRKSVV